MPFPKDIEELPVGQEEGNICEYQGEKSWFISFTCLLGNFKIGAYLVAKSNAKTEKYSSDDQHCYVLREGIDESSEKETD